MAVPARTGVPTLQRVAQELCKYIVRFTPIIRLAYPQNAAILAALDAALAACSVLDQELSAVRDIGD